MLWTERPNEVARLMEQRQLKNEEDQQMIINSLLRMLNNPLCCNIPNNGIPHLHNIVRFSFEYLVREGLFVSHKVPNSTNQKDISICKEHINSFVALSFIFFIIFLPTI